MKNIFAGLLLVLVGFFISPFSLSAQTTTELAAKLAALQAMVRELQAQLTALQAGIANDTPSSPTPVTPPPAFCYTFTRNLRVGDRGADVDALVQVLVKEGLLSSALNARILGEDFNESVASAVTALQEKYFSDILRPVALTHGNGFVGPATRAKLNALYACRPEATPMPTPVAQPSITVLSPNGGESYVSGSSIIRIQYLSTNLSGAKLTASLVPLVPTTGQIIRTVTSPVSGDSGNIDMYLGKGAADPAGNKYKITICSDRYTTLSGADVCDSSDSFFTIETSVPPVQPSVLSPSGNPTYARGSTITVTWIPQNRSKVGIAFCLASARTTCSESVLKPDTGSASLPLTGAHDLSAGQWVAEVLDVDRDAIYGYSGAFTITQPVVQTPTPTTAPTISVSAGTLLPHSLAPRGSVAPFTNLVLTPKGGTARVDGIVVERSGGGGNSDGAFMGVIAYDTYKGKIIGEAVFNSASQAHLRFYEPLSFSSVKTLTIAGVMGDDLAANAGRTPTLNVVQINSSNEIFGAFPISGSMQTINVGLSIGRLHYAFSPSYKSFSALWIKNGSIEPVRLEGILLKNHGGSVSIGGDKYSCSANYSNRGDLCVINRVIGKGESITIVPVSGAAQMRDMSDLNVLNSLNIIATGELYGYHTLPVWTEWPVAMPQPISGATVSTELLSETADKAGAWYLFSPGRGHGNVSTADWVWQAKLSLHATKRIKSIVLAHNTPGEFWSTSADMTGIGKLAYPLVVVASNGNQLNASYDQPFAPDTSAPAYGNFDFPTGAYTFKLYGQRESENFTGGKLTVTFTDGTSVTGTVGGATVTMLPSIITNVAGMVAGNFEIDAGGKAGISGSNLTGGNGTRVYVGNREATITQLGDTLIYASMPPDLMVGAYYELYLTSSEGKIKSNSVKVKVLSKVAAPVPSISVLSPNGVEVWSIGSSYSIKWETKDSNRGVEVSLERRLPTESSYIDLGKLNGGIYDFSPASGTFQWTIPATKLWEGRYIELVSGASYRIRINQMGARGDELVVYSRPFTITAPEATPIPTPVIVPAAVPETSVTVMSPNGGESFVAGQEVTATLKVSTTRADLKYGLALAPYSDAGYRLIDFPVLSACGKINTAANSACKDVLVTAGAYTTNLLFKVPSPLVPSDTVATKYKLEAYLVESAENKLITKDLSDTTFTIPVAK